MADDQTPAPARTTGLARTGLARTTALARAATLVRTAALVRTMPAGRPRRRSAVALAGAALLLVAGCADGDAGGAETTEPPAATDAPAATETATPEPLTLTAGSFVVGLPDDLAAPPTDASAGAARTTDPTLLYVVTFGSSTCPSIADPTATSTGEGAIEITFPEPEDGICTQDYVPATTVVALPDGVEGAGDLSVGIGQWGQATLPAGWTEPGWVLAEG